MNTLTQMTDHEKEEFVSMMEREVGAWNDMLTKSIAGKGKKPGLLKQEPLIEKCKEIYRQIRSEDSTARVPKCMEDELSPPYAKGTIKSMVKGQVNRLKLKKDGGEPTGSSANQKVRNAKAKEKRIASSTEEELEAHRLNNNAINQKAHMKRKLSSQVVDTTTLSNKPRMELLSNECLAVISRAAAGSDELNYILRQKGDTALLKRMDLPPLSDSKMDELCEYFQATFFLNVFIIQYQLTLFIKLIQLRSLLVSL